MEIVVNAPTPQNEILVYLKPSTLVTIANELEEYKEQKDLSSAIAKEHYEDVLSMLTTLMGEEFVAKNVTPWS